MKKTMKSHFILSVICLLGVYTPIAYALDEAANHDNSEKVISVLNIKQLSMRQFARLLSQGSDWKVIVSQGASEINVSVYLEDVYAEDALKAICQAYNLWYKKDPTSGVVSIITLDEYQKGMRVHNQEAVEVITLRYPDAKQVGDSLQRLFRDRVIWNRPDDQDDEESIEELELALERMDALADRAQFSDTDSGGSGSNNSSFNSNSSRSSSRRNSRFSNNQRFSRNSISSRYPGSSYGGTSMQENKVIDDIVREVAPESLLEMLAQSGNQPVTGRIDQPGIVYISVFKGSNDLLLRSNDAESLKEIIKVIKELDKPKPQVLLEVKVLDILLDDEQASGIDWLFQAGDFSGGRSSGINSNEFGTGFKEILSPSTSLVPQGSGLEPRSTVMQLVTDNVLARIQLLEDRNRLTRLATPTLCVADNEASRVFVGTETTILTSVEITQDTTTGDNPVTTTATNPETERKNVGTTLLITPRIHADRTATIRIVQEESTLGSIQTINYGQGESFQAQDVETSSVVTTIVAADGKISAIGGLIREQTGSRQTGTPGLMDMPLIGSLFKTKFASTERHELLVLIRPFILLAPGETEPVSRELMQRLSEHPSARDDIPAMRIGEGDFPVINDNLHHVPSEAIESLKNRASVWETE